MTRSIARSIALILCWLCFALTTNSQNASSSILITNARLIDGTGKHPRHASVRISGDRIIEIGNLKPKPNEQVIDARNLVLAPGFIDIHNHSTEGLAKDPIAESQISQGITSLVLGADGDSPWPMAPFLDERRNNPASLNVAVMVGHATIREQILGKDFRRVATGAEIAKMSDLVTQGMKDGGIGLSSGLEYEVACYSDTKE